jgi:hypothetical protein
MSNQKKLVFIILAAYLLRFFLIYLNYHNSNFSFAQESYIYYINALKSGLIFTSDFSTFESRLFPGYILLIFPFTFIFDKPIVIGSIINLILFGFSFLLIWKIFKNILTNLIFAFFPPIWVVQSTKASTEPLTVTLLLFSLFLFIKKWYLSVGLVLGLLFSVRTIAICMLPALIIPLISKRKFSEIIKIIVGFFMTASLLFAYNYLIFGVDGIFIQFNNLDQNYGVVRIGFIQIIDDIFRTIDWGQYRILISGLLYVTVNLVTLIVLFKFRNISDINKILFYWILLSLLFVFSLSPFTLIENFGRYMVPIAPAVAVAFTILLTQIRIKYFK